MRVLIAYGSKRGGTAGLAEMIALELSSTGIDTTVQPARDVSGLDGFDAVVIAGALYANRWHKDARRFARRHAAALRARRVWLVSSGPLDNSAADGAIPPVKQVEAVSRKIGARGQVTFGGRLEPTAAGLVARNMAKNHAGDWRDPDQVRNWAALLAWELNRP